MRAHPSPTLLIVEDDDWQARTLQRALRGPFQIRVVDRAQDARTLLAEAPRLLAAIIDVGLPGGSGLDLLCWMREGPYHQLPVLVLTGIQDAAVANRSFELEAKHLRKPVSIVLVQSFVDGALAGTAGSSELDRRRVAALTRRHGLTPRESEVVLHALAHKKRDLTALEMGISVSAVKLLVASVLRKCGEESMRDLVLKLSLTDPDE